MRPQKGEFLNFRREMFVWTGYGVKDGYLTCMKFTELKKIHLHVGKMYTY